MKYLSYSTLVGVLLLLGLGISTALAGVNQNNGNFYITYTDLKVEDEVLGESYEISRTYNSQATRSGVWGRGWGSEMDTYLILDPRGAPIVKENGSGATRRYEPQEKSIDSDYLSLNNETIQAILELEKEYGELTHDQMDELKGRLLDSNNREEYWEKWVVSGELVPPKPVVGTQYKNRCSCSYKSSEIIVTMDGYKRIFPDGRVEFFNPLGQMTSFIDKNGLMIKFDRDDQLGLIRSVQVGNETLFLFYNQSGKIIRLLSNGKMTFYHYNNKSDLIYSLDVAGNEYRYSYDENFNLTKISYANGTSMNIDYEENTQFVNYILYPSGEQHFYEYVGNDDLKYGTRFKKITAPKDGSVVSEEYVEFTHLKDEAGSTLRDSVVTEANQVRRTIYYKKGIPYRIVERSLLKDTPNATLDLNFTIDEFGRIEELKAGKWSQRFGYVGSSKHLLQSLLEISGHKSSYYQFEYDSLGRLHSVTKDGYLISIEYSSKESSDVIALKSNQSDKLSFHYNQDGQLDWVSSDTGAKLSLFSTATNGTNASQALEVGAKWSAMQRILLKSRAKLSFGDNDES